MSAEHPPATLRLRIDRAAIAANWRTLDAMSGTARAGAAVKADAYGVGVDAAMPALVEAGAKDFFVAHWSEVPALLKYVPGGQVAVLHGVGNAREAAFAQALGVRPVINSAYQAAIWNEAAGGPCHLMVDSGINRLGLPPSELAAEPVARLEVHTLMSHLASADEDSAKNAQQLAAFRQAIEAIPAREYSLANSAGVALGSDFAFDLTRPGLALYGGVPRPELAGQIRQVVFPEAAVIQTRRLQPGDSVGYNATFTAHRDMRVATVSLGYADGFLRARGPGGVLLHEGRELPILGLVSMDMIVVDCSDAPEVDDGDFLQVPFDLPAIADASGFSQYELLTTLGKRFDRVMQAG